MSGRDIGLTNHLTSRSPVHCSCYTDVTLQLKRVGRRKRNPAEKKVRRQKLEYLVVRESCEAMYSDILQAQKERIFDSWILSSVEL